MVFSLLKEQVIGGTFVWDGKDKMGKRVASGIYMVLSADENGDKGTVCKVAIIN